MVRYNREGSERGRVHIGGVGGGSWRDCGVTSWRWISMVGLLRWMDNFADLDLTSL